MDEQTLGTSLPNAAPAAFGVSGARGLGEWQHSLLVLAGQQPGRRIELGDKPLVLGRRRAADLVLPELQVSGLHCRVQIDRGLPALKVTDLKSTNGSFINGQRIAGSAYLAPGATLAVGQHLFRHDFLSPERLLSTGCEEAARDQAAAAGLPTLQGSPVRTECCYRAAEPPGGAGSAVLPLADERVALILIDVNGPADHVARHAARVLQELQDIGNPAGPAQLFQQLHERWRQGAHVGLFITAWAAIYDPATHRLSHASAGQHPALLRVPDGEMLRLEALNPPIGLLPNTEFTEDALTVPPGSRLYLFNRGAFDFADRSGHQLALDDIEAVLACLPVKPGNVPERAFAQLRGMAESARLGDDFLLIATELAC